ncbi:unnamed protein product [Prunus brigantina]
MEYMRNCQEKPCNDLCWQAGKNMARLLGLEQLVAICGGNMHVPFPLNSLSTTSSQQYDFSNALLEHYHLANPRQDAGCKSQTHIIDDRYDSLYGGLNFKTREPLVPGACAG